MSADGRNLDFETMDFLEKYFPLEVKKRQKENERALLERNYGEEFVRPPQCTVM
jgi:E3 ubiquitin-protein ligase BAH